MHYTHYAFSDDSRHHDGRYNSLSLVTLERKQYKTLNDKLEDLLYTSNVNDEFKWEKLRNAKYRFMAEKFIDFAFQYTDLLRIDIIIWDLNDERHKGVKSRDDSENLVRMYYHLVSSTFSKRYSIPKVCWKWRPDKQSSVDWTTLHDCLKNTKHDCITDLFQLNPDVEMVDLRKIIPSESQNFPFIQMADLFAGIGSYSFGHFDQYKKWQIQSSKQISMFDIEEYNFSNSENERFSVITKLDKMAKDRGLKIALTSSKGFKSYDPNCFLNFWQYMPQHEYDKAPRKITRYVIH